MVGWIWPGLALEDIDWRHGELTVRGKGHREDRLPLPNDVGQAIVDYLQHARPRRRPVVRCSSGRRHRTGR